MQRILCAASAAWLSLSAFGQGSLVQNGGFEEDFAHWEWTVNFGIFSASSFAAEGQNIGEIYGTIGQNLFILANKFNSICSGTYPPDLLIPGVQHYFTQDTPG